MSMSTTRRVRASTPVTGRGLSLAVALVLIPVAALAQDADAQRTAAARQLFHEGSDLADARRWAEAADRYGRALELHDSPVLAYNLALALKEVGRLVEATEHLHRVARDADASAALRRSASDWRTRLLEQVGQLVIRLEGDPRQIRVTLDQRPVPEAMIGVPIPADPGRRVVEVRRQSGAVVSGEVDVVASQTAELTLEVPSLPEVPSPAQTAALATPPAEGRLATHGSRRHEAGSESVLEQWWFWTVAGVVVAGAVTTAVLVASGGQDPPLNGTTAPGRFEFGK